MLKDKKILIVGGGSLYGIGYCIAKQSIQQGAKVMISGRNKDALTKNASELGCEWIDIDLQRVSEFQQKLSQVVRRLGGLDILVLNGGLSGGNQDILSISEDWFDNIMNTNFKGFYFFAREFLKYHMSNTSISRNILFVSSIAGQQKSTNIYPISKGAVCLLNDAISKAFWNKNIRCNSICPAITNTDRVRTVCNPDIHVGQMEIYDPMIVAESAIFLMDDEKSKYTSGVDLCIDNGYHHNMVSWQNF